MQIQNVNINVIQQTIEQCMTRRNKHVRNKELRIWVVYRKIKE